MARTQTPAGAIPRGCDATYRGWLADTPKKFTANGREFARARIGVNMAAPDVPRVSRI